MLIDLTHTLSHGMPVYPGDTVPAVTQSAWVEHEGFAHFDVHAGVHAGTHMDGPAHMILGGRKLCELPVERFMADGKIVTLDVSVGNGGENVQITPRHVEAADLQPGEALLIHTGYSSHFNDPLYFTNYPVLTEETAHYLVAKKIGLLGIDWPSPDREPFAVHKILLAAEILIIENLTNLEEFSKHILPLPRGGAERSEAKGSFTLHALPLKIDADSAPCRVVARL